MASIRKVKTTIPGVFKWELRLRLNGRGSKRFRRRFDKRIDAEKFLEKLNEESHRLKQVGIDPEDESRRTFRTEAEYWLERRRLSFSPGSLYRTEGILVREFLPRFGDLPAMYFNIARITDLQNQMLRQGKAPRTVNRYISVIKAILNFSARHQRIAFNPSLHAKPLSPAKTKMGFWEPHDVERFLIHCNQKYPVGTERRWIYIVYLLALNTGLRSGEIWGLQVRDLQKNRDLIHIARQLDYVSRQLRECKGKSDRFVPCHRVLRRELEAWIQSQGISGSDLMFHGKHGNPIEDHSFKRHFFRKDIQEAGVREIRFHDLRHTAATLMIASGIDLPTVQSILDHKDVSTTMLYVHLLSDSVQKVASRFAVLPRHELGRDSE